jgi:capsular polysaccharide biosynthesis protein
MAPDGSPVPSRRMRRFWVFFLLTALAAFSGAAGHLAARVPAYSTQALIAFVPMGERPVSAAAVELMVPKYVAYATSPFVVRQVASSTGLPATRLQSHLTVSMAATTANVSITMVSSDPELATKIANRIAALVVERAASDPVLGVRLLAAAAVPADPQGPSRPLLLVGAGFASALLGLGAGLLGRGSNLVWRGIGRRRWAFSAEKVASGSVPAWPGPEHFKPSAADADWGASENNPWGAALAAGRIPSLTGEFEQPAEPAGDSGHTAPFSLPDFGDDDDPDVEPAAPAESSARRAGATRQ